MSEIATRAYFSSPVWLQNAVISAYGLRLRFMRYGREQQRALKDLLQTQWLDSEQLADLQRQRLRKLVDHSRDTVPLYRDRIPEAGITDLKDLTEIPLLYKADLRAPREQVISRRYSDARLVEIHTGGTTGSPLTIYCDSSTLQRNYAFFARLRSWAGVPAGGRTATFAGRTLVPPDQCEPPFWRFNAAMNTLLFSSYHITPSTIPLYVARLRQFAPDLVDAYPSSIEPIARFILDEGITDLRPRAIVTSSETLDVDVRHLLNKAFGCPVFDYYGAAEMAALITQCEMGEYHVNPEFGVVEILSNGRPAAPGELGEIVGSGFINEVMPLIRYATGDEGMWKEGSCACGRAFPMLERIEGRRDDLIITPEGRRIGRLDPIFKAVSSIFEAQIVQEAPDRVCLNIVGKDITDEEEKSLLFELQNRLGPAMRIELRKVSRIPRTSRGKFRSVVNLVS